MIKKIDAPPAHVADEYVGEGILSSDMVMVCSATRLSECWQRVRPNVDWVCDVTGATIPKHGLCWKPASKLGYTRTISVKGMREIFKDCPMVNII